LGTDCKDKGLIVARFDRLRLLLGIFLNQSFDSAFSCGEKKHYLFFKNKNFIVFIKILLIKTLILSLLVSLYAALISKLHFQHCFF
jgi:hypothetical protein